MDAYEHCIRSTWWIHSSRHFGTKYGCIFLFLYFCLNFFYFSYKCCYYFVLFVFVDSTTILLITCYSVCINVISYCTANVVLTLIQVLFTKLSSIHYVILLNFTINGIKIFT